MAFPVGVLTASVVISRGFTATGDGVTVAATARALAHVIHEASGEPLIPIILKAVPVDAAVTLVIPFDDQPGFVDASGAPITGWGYEIEVTRTVDGGGMEQLTRRINVVTGQDVIDFDLIPAGSPTQTVGGTLAVVTSINGQTGAVVIDGLTGGIESVNGQTGVVVLDAVDVGAQPAGSYVLGSDSRLTDARTPTTHTHTVEEVTGLQTALDSKQGAGDYATNTALTTGLSGKQAAGDYATNTDLSTGLSGKQATGDYATNTALTTGLSGKQDAGDYATNTDLTTGLAGKAPTSHTHTIANVTGLQTALDGKQASGDYATNTALTSGLAGKAATVHTHAIADSTGLQDALDSKGTSNLALGTSDTTAKAGDWTPTIEDMPAGSTITVYFDVTWPDRPTARGDITVFWAGPDPSPAIVTSGVGGMRDGVDFRLTNFGGA